jgi:regulatory protein
LVLLGQEFQQDRHGCGDHRHRSRFAFEGDGTLLSAKVTALKVQKKNQDRVNVYLDGRFAFGLPAIVAAGLKPGQSLSEAEVQSLQEQGTMESAYNRTLDYLSYRPRSRAEVVTYLQKRDVAQSQIDEIVERLERSGLVDDEAFARFWVENRERFRPRGPRALRYELRGKGVSSEVIEQALAMVDPTESAYRAAEKKARQLGHTDQPTFYRKLVEYLARRGFGYEVARQIAERHWDELMENGEHSP